MPDTKTGAPNIQDVFLNYARREKLAVVHPPARRPGVRGRIKNFDRFALIVEHGDGPPDLQARDRDDPHAAQRPQLLLLASGPDAAPCPSRVIVIVLDSVGIGELPDAAHTATRAATRSATSPPPVALRSRRCGAGLSIARGRSIGVICPASPTARIRPHGRASPGKDSVTGHWELMGVVLDRAVPDVSPTVSAGADRRVRAAHRPRTIGNVVASGTAIIDELGAEHMRTGAPIVYTSATACSRSPRTRTWCRCRALPHGARSPTSSWSRAWGVGRVIARPFVGRPGAFQRTPNRHDYAMPPLGETLLDRLTRAGTPVTRIGKINDLFAGRGIARRIRRRATTRAWTRSSADGDAARGLIFANLVDFDTVYGHRNDVAGYAANLERFDARLAELLPRLRRTICWW